MKVLDLFSGIGGFALGLERAGMTTAMFCEIEPFCRRVLAKHWPEVPIHDDVRTLGAGLLAEHGVAVDLVCGGFPCQNISVAGKGEGLEGDRSRLWFEYLRVIEEVAPRWVVIENVPALRSRGLDTVLGGLAALGYDAEWHCIPASAVGAHHRRDRIWLVAHAARDVGAEQAAGRAERQRIRACGPESGAGDVADADKPRLEIVIDRHAGQLAPPVGAGTWGFEPDVGGAADGLSAGLDGVAAWERDVPRVAYRVPDRVARLRALGNSVVPQVVEAIGRAIMAAEAKGLR